MPVGRKKYNLQLGQIEKTGSGRQFNSDSGIIIQADYEIGMPFIICAIGDGEGSSDDYHGNEMSRKAVELFTRIINSQGIADIIKEQDPEKIKASFVETFKKVNEKINKLSEKNTEHSHTTLTGVVIAGDQIYIGHVGNCRVYKINENEVKKLTDDHVQQYGAKGEETFEDKGSGVKLTRVIGAVEEVECDFYTDGITPQDFIILCTDGYHVNVSEPVLREYYKRNLSIAAFCANTAEIASDISRNDDIFVMGLQVEQPGEKTEAVAGTEGKESKKPAFDIGKKMEPAVAYFKDVWEKIKTKYQQMSKKEGFIPRMIIYVLLFILCFYLGGKVFSLIGKEFKKDVKVRREGAKPRPTSRLPEERGGAPDLRMAKPDDVNVTYYYDGKAATRDSFNKFEKDKEYMIVIEGAEGGGLYTVSFLCPWNSIVVNQWFNTPRIPSEAPVNRNRIRCSGGDLTIHLTRGSQFFVEPVKNFPDKKVVRVNKLGSEMTITLRNCDYFTLKIEKQ